jgi:hypothetical protein
MAGEPLREKEVAGGTINVRHRRVSKGMQGIETVESRTPLPDLEGHLNPSLRDSSSGLIAEERGMVVGDMGGMDF